MKRVVPYLCGATLLVSCAVFIWSLRAASAQNCIDWGALWRVLAAADTADVEGRFDLAQPPGTWGSQLLFNWWIVRPPFIGVVEFQRAESTNIGGVTYTPLYYFPSSCIGSQAIQVSGSLNDPNSNGTLKTKGWIWASGDPPIYREDIHTLTVYRS